ncbi:MAG: site-specific DNA-methyltransferase, partial [SAR324 cluster bacterium]|nr:site-specific DNA-methyltransferase [SAR324 cluster bacterium]
RVLRPDGALYLHCDPNASHYLKILLDALFGPRNFRNEIVWHYYNKFSAGKRVFARSFDQIFFYSAGDRYVFNPIREPRQEPVRQLLRENVGGILKNRKDAAGKTMTRTVHDRKVDAVWRIPCLQYASREFCGFPTQKPQALLERIIRASSNPGEIVLDPFCGCGTALLAAQKLGRGWIGIDKSPLAMGLVQTRISEVFPDLPYRSHDLPPAETVPALNRAKKRPAL